MPTCFLIRVFKIRLDVAYASGMAGNHAEPCRYVGTFALKKLLNHNLHLDKGFIDKIRCCLCARDDREPCRTMQNHTDRWGLSHLEPPKSQPTLVELRSSQVGVPTCFFIRVL